MDITTKRILLFLFGCLVTRTILVVLAKKINNKYLPYLGVLSLIPALGFFIIFFGGFRKTGGETFGKPIWWNNLRPIHGTLYLIFAYLAINKNKNSYLPLLIDVIIGIIAYIYFNLNTFVNSIK